jgi:DeoR/GlpR family transcriptional regulator of sugar metabolism
MRRPINSSVPEDLILRVDEFVKSSKGGYKDRSHLVEQAINFYLGDVEAPVKAASEEPASSLYETSLFPRLAMNIPAKQAIAGAAAGLVGPGKTLFLDGGTTCIQLAKQLANQRKGLTIVSNSTLVCLELGHNGEHKILGVGGEYDSSSASFVGCTCEEAVERFYVDFAFFSTKGFLPEDGTYESSMGTLRVKQAVARRCAKVVLLVDHTKFDQRSLCKVLDIDQIHCVVTDELAPPQAVDRLRQNGREVLIAKLPAPKNPSQQEG